MVKGFDEDRVDNHVTQEWLTNTLEPHVELYHGGPFQVGSYLEDVRAGFETARPP